LQEIREFKQSGSIEDDEFDSLKLGRNQTFSNAFLDTADEAGISRFEKILNIRSDATQPLETRKNLVKSRITYRPPYTWRVLLSKISSLVGSENFVLTFDEANFTLTLKTRGADPAAVQHELDSLIPANLIFKSLEILITWQNIADYEKTWLEWNNLGLTWYDFLRYSE
jgi:hypothetical protein